MSEEGAEALADQPLADVVVAVAVRAEGRFRVVRVECAKSVEAHARIDVREQRVERSAIGDVHARRVEVTRVEAEPEPLVPAERVEDRRELVEPASARAPPPGRAL